MSIFSGHSDRDVRRKGDAGPEPMEDRSSLRKLLMDEWDLPRYEPAGCSSAGGSVLPVPGTTINHDLQETKCGLGPGDDIAQSHLLTNIPCLILAVEDWAIPADCKHSKIREMNRDETWPESAGWGFEVAHISMGNSLFLRARRKLSNWQGSPVQDIQYQFAANVVSLPSAETELEPWVVSRPANWDMEGEHDTGGFRKPAAHRHFEDMVVTTIKFRVCRLSVHMRKLGHQVFLNFRHAATLYLESLRHSSYGVQHSVVDKEVMRIPDIAWTKRFFKEKGKVTAEFVLRSAVMRTSEPIIALDVHDMPAGGKRWVALPNLGFYDHFAFCEIVSAKAVNVSILRGPTFVYPIGSRLRVVIPPISRDGSDVPFEPYVDPEGVATIAGLANWKVKQDRSKMTLGHHVREWPTPWREATVEGLTSDGLYVIRFDGDYASYLFDPTVYNHRATSIFRQPRQRELIVFFPPHGWVAAYVVNVIGRSCRHLLQLRDLKQTDPRLDEENRVWMDLNAFNHSPMLTPPHLFDAAVTQFMREVAKRHSFVVNIITGELLDVEQQCLTLNVHVKKTDDVGDKAMAAFASVFKKHGAKPVDGWPVLESILEPSYNRDRGFHSARSIVMLGEPAAGKSTFMNQLIMLAVKQGGFRTKAPRAGNNRRHSFEQSAGTSRNVEFVPILIPVVDLARRLRSRSSTSAQESELLHAFLWDVYPVYAEALIQATHARRVLLLFDGLDEGGDFKAEIDSYIAHLGALDHRVICTSRPAGYQPHKFAAHFVTLELQPLAVKQQAELGAKRLTPDELELFMEGAKGYSVLASNPLTLTLLLYDFQLHDKRTHWGSQPITAIYRKALTAIISRFERNLVEGVPGHTMTQEEMTNLVSKRREEDLDILKRMALVAHMRKVKDVSSAVEGELAAFGGPDDVAIWTRITEAAKDGAFPTISTFMDGQTRLFRFAHLTFQEYLWAVACADWLEEGNSSLMRIPHSARLRMVLLILTLRGGWWQQGLSMLREILHDRHGHAFETEVAQASQRDVRITLEDLDWRSALDILYDISKPGYEEVLKQILNEWKPGAHDDFPLLVVAQQGLARECSALIELKVNIDQQNANGRTALTCALCQGFVDVVETLLDSNADPNVTDKDSCTALHWLLITAPTRIDRTSQQLQSHQSRGQLRQTVTTLGFAVKTYHGGFSVKMTGPTAAPAKKHVTQQRAGVEDLVVFADRFHLPKLLVESAANPNIQDGTGRTCLHWAVAQQLGDVAALLLTSGASVNIRETNGRTAAMMATFAGSFDLVERMLPHLTGSALLARDNNGCGLIHYAFNAGHLVTVERLLAARDVGRQVATMADNKGIQPLHLAAQHGQEFVVERLRKAFGLDLNVQDNAGMTAVMHAVRHKKKGMVQLLLQLKADPNVFDFCGRTACHWAVVDGAPGSELVSVLIDKKADPNIGENNSQGFKPLHLAAWQGLPTASTLLAGGAHATCIDGFYQTPLHYATEKEYRSVVSKLVAADVDADFADSMGRTPRTKAHAAAVKRLLTESGKGHLVEDEPRGVHAALPYVPSFRPSGAKSPRKRPLY